MLRTIARTVLVFAAACSAGSEPPATNAAHHVDAAGAQALIAAEAGLTLLDIRTPQEFAEGHLEGAVNIDYRGADFRERLAELDPTGAYLVYCRSGGRSTSSLPVFAELGFGRLHHLDGGINAWNAAKLPTTR